MEVNLSDFAYRRLFEDLSKNRYGAVAECVAEAIGICAGEESRRTNDLVVAMAMAGPLCLSRSVRFTDGTILLNSIDKARTAGREVAKEIGCGSGTKTDLHGNTHTIPTPRFLQAAKFSTEKSSTDFSLYGLAGLAAIAIGMTWYSPRAAAMIAPFALSGILAYYGFTLLGSEKTIA